MTLFSSASSSSSNNTTLLQLFQSISQNHMHTIRNILSKFWIVVDKQDLSTGVQAIHIAARRGVIEIMTILLRVTPLGEVQMNDDKTVAFLKMQFAFRRQPLQNRGSVISSLSSGERTTMTADSHTLSSSSTNQYDESYHHGTKKNIQMEKNMDKTKQTGRYSLHTTSSSLHQSLSHHVSSNRICEKQHHLSIY